MNVPSLTWLPFALLCLGQPASARAQTPPASAREPLPPLPPLPAEPTARAPVSAPAANPAEKPPATATATEEVEVQLSARQRDIQFHIWTDNSGYVKVCTAPCRSPFVPGKYYFALSEGDTGLTPIDPLVIKAPSRLEGTYVSRSGWRTAGLLTFIGSIAAGVTIGFAGSERRCSDSGECHQYVSTGAGIAAFAVAIVGGITGLVMASRPDKVGIRIAPLSPAPSARLPAPLLFARPDRAAAAATDGLAGLQLHLRF